MRLQASLSTAVQTPSITLWSRPASTRTPAHWPSISLAKSRRRSRCAAWARSTFHKGVGGVGGRVIPPTPLGAGQRQFFWGVFRKPQPPRTARGDGGGAAKGLGAALSGFTKSLSHWLLRQVERIGCMPSSADGPTDGTAWRPARLGSRLL